MHVLTLHVHVVSVGESGMKDLKWSSNYHYNGLMLQMYLVDVINVIS